MERETKILTINSLERIPSIDTIRELPRNVKLKLVFDETIQDQRESIGQNLKKELKEFLVGINAVEPEINISKLITDKEIQDNKLFFEKSAKDYRKLSNDLIYKLADKLGIPINPDSPLQTFNPLKNTNRQTGAVDDWKYFLHGFHCGFEHKNTKQYIEVSLVFGLEFGVLDPYFFTQFIKSTPEYKPLPVKIYEDYGDGVRINEVMLSLGKFERINSNRENDFGVVVADRSEIENVVYKPKDKKARFGF